MKLIVGLGNLEAKYDGTRHNVGFDVVNALARDHQATWSNSKMSAHVTTIQPASGEKIVLAKPTTLMNRSGFAVVQLLMFFNELVPERDLLVVCDDFNLDLGWLRMRAKGSHGGQNGLRNIIQQLGMDDFQRLRLGIGPVPQYTDPAYFVLAKFKASEQKDVDDMVLRATMAALTWNVDGVDKAQQRFNGGPNDAK